MLGGVSMNKQEVKSRLEKILGKLFEKLAKDYEKEFFSRDMDDEGLGSFW